ncbi:PLP-dependent aminotransferase family protein [Streptomyces sp. SCA3-4]|uniref:MocR-like pyridoxine biosynthesis transcription factor PdxR n=1 Tax=Streptomyces sichuanensis TaxID=2871810 RepID=UPI001CE28650|nr:PLP-dependent aminotransferase family protein [Streptomyces sichuanensis]MCA6095470.1 PLP-dependent aminotransferase family protein [Streptomyces sichuanensis]
MSWHLALSVDRTAGHPLTAQVRENLCRLIDNGTLQPGSRLPSSRQLAADLRVSRSVVVEAYEQLSAEGYLTARHGSGTKVAEHLGSYAGGSALTGGHPEPGHTAARWDLRTGKSDVSSFPHQEWIRSMTAVLTAAGGTELGYGPPSGALRTRHVLGQYLGRVRGVRTHLQDTMITSGFAQGLALLCRVLRDRGHETLGVEDPGHPGEREFITSAGLRPVGIPVDDEGLRVDLLERSGVRAVLTTPGNQFPTGARLSRQRREKLVAWARAVDGYVVEDDFDGTYTNRSDVDLALQHLAPDRVVYAGSASKVLAPALRLGWLAGPSELMACVEKMRIGWDIGCSGVEQLTFAHFVSTGAFDRHQRRLRTEFRKRRELLQDLVPHHLPGAEIVGKTSASHAYVRLPPDVDEAALTKAARTRSVLIHGGGFYAMEEHPRPPSLVVGYAAVDSAGLQESMAELGTAYREVRGRGSRQ